MNKKLRKVLILSDNIYYRYGIWEMLSDICASDIEFICKRPPFIAPDIIFSEAVASIYVSLKTADRGKKKTDKTLLDIPFFCSSMSFSQIQIKLEKIMSIIYTGLTFSHREDIYHHFGVKAYQQISQMEDKVIRFIGKGYSVEDIATTLNSSEKTVKTHCRNAMRKMALTTKVEFYHFAREIAWDTNMERLTLCI